jgi:hypothetical protein
MILSTLPAVPGRDLEIRGLVLAEGFSGFGGKIKSVGQAMQAIAQQAAQLGANAVVDVRVIRLNGAAWVVTGTAVVIQD